MCVTNTINRRVQPISFNVQQVNACNSNDASALTQGLFYNGLPSFQFPTQEYVANVPAEKPRPKRRRKPQKPGLTAKNHERHFVVHNYHDHANDNEADYEEVEEPSKQCRGGVAVTFPMKLHAVLSQVEVDGWSHVVSWQAHGRCFVIHKPKEFVDHVMPKYFRQSKLTSFQRQLNLYGFQRLTRGDDAGGYYHELFLRGREFLTKKMIRVKVKGTKFKAASSPENEPDFYQMPPVIVSPNNSEDEFSNQSYASTVQQVAPTYLDPVPIQYACAQPEHQFYQAPQQFSMTPTFAPSNEVDRILDEAVEELFFHEGDTANLADFVQAWDPNVEEQAHNSFTETLENDSQLGFMLEKLLED